MTGASERARLAAVEHRRESPSAYVEYQMLSARRGMWPRILRHLSDPAGKRALDVGCGTGGLALFLASQGLRVSAVDNQQYDPVALDTARSEARRRQLAVEVRHADASSLPYESRSFDLIVCSQVFEHLSDPEAAIAEIERVLAPGGLAMVDFPGWYGPFNGHIDDTVRLPWAHLLPRDLVRRLAQPHDFAVYQTLAGLSYQRFESIARDAGLGIIEARPMWFLTHAGRALVRGAFSDAVRTFRREPSEVLRFAFLAATAPLSYIPYIREFFAAGYRYALRHQTEGRDLLEELTP